MDYHKFTLRNTLFSEKRQKIENKMKKSQGRKLEFTLCIRETPKRVLLQAMKTLMKCSIMLHFIRVYTVCKGKKISSGKIIQYFFKIISQHP